MRPILPLVLLLAACTAQPEGGPQARLAAVPAATPQTVMANVLRGMRRCWFTSGRGYGAYRLEDERDSYSNRPRILIVPRSDPGGKPKLVAEAYGPKPRLDVYGPLATPKRKAAIRRFGAGGTECL